MAVGGKPGGKKVRSSPRAWMEGKDGLHLRRGRLLTSSPKKKKKIPSLSHSSLLFCIPGSLSRKPPLEEEETDTCDAGPGEERASEQEQWLQSGGE